MKYYINRKGNYGYHETVSELPNSNMTEASELAAEYQLSDPSATYYVSQRPRGNWKDD
jgi:hypothetical protein